MNSVTIAFMMTAIAGLSTLLGSVFVFFMKKDNAKALSVSLGFSAGVMLFISMNAILVSAQNDLSAVHGDRIGGWLAISAFFIGMLCIALIDRLIPSNLNPHEATHSNQNKLYRMGLLSAAAIGLHNLPEGMVSFISALQDPVASIPVIVAIAIHNVPEGMVVSLPIYQATGSKRKAFYYSFLSGIAEPIGALLAYSVLQPFLSETLFAVIFAGVAGIMVYISLDVLLPSAREYGEHHLSLYGLIAGMFVMAASLLLFV